MHANLLLAEHNIHMRFPGGFVVVISPPAKCVTAQHSTAHSVLSLVQRQAALACMVVRPAWPLKGQPEVN